MLDVYGTWKAALNMVRCGIGNCIVQENFEASGVYWIIDGGILKGVSQTDIRKITSTSCMSKTSEYRGDKFKASVK